MTPSRFQPPSARIMLGLAIGLLLTLSATMVLASSGDRQPEYVHCVNECDNDICKASDLSTLTSEQLATRELSPSLRFAHCKWPFYRLFGMQEPASVFFSLLNGYMHYRAWPKLKKLIPENYYMRKFYLGYAIVGMNTWLWSAVYHSRDWPSTEKLDYFSAGAAITYGLYYTVVRITRMVSVRKQVLWAIVCLIPLLAHISYLTFVRFDYGYNMAATGTVGAIHNVWWLGWSIANWKSRPYAWEPTVSAALITAAMCLEILDFAPLWGVLDAHSLWHCATIPLVPIWYRFLLQDTEFEVRNMKGVLHQTHQD
ncbi:hypothetical protein BGZ52_007464 [Haplosporangium bisporale]|nr:hypothetical protein BGZ52_007464 [Haplosporangium bisporale]